MTRVYLALGSNLGDRRAMLRDAVDALGAIVDLDAISQVYETPPMYETDQPAFLNMAVGANTDLTPHDLLSRLRALETALGRVPSYVNGPRALDIDILYYGDVVLSTEQLTLPHPRIAERAFVLVPLAEIAADFVGPTDSRPVSELLSAVPGKEDVVIVPGSLQTQP